MFPNGQAERLVVLVNPAAQGELITTDHVAPAKNALDQGISTPSITAGPGSSSNTNRHTVNSSGWPFPVALVEWRG
ncbi:MAG: hypothetical protein M3O70_23990 [Actinomycetota bacterium]|nr:hypothetical protein [Actinomycetota bacterium]